MSTCCNQCLNDEVGCLREGDTLTLNISGLINGGDYLAEITTPEDASYIVPFTFDGTTNQVELPVGDGDGQIPPAVFNKYIGELSIRIMDAETHQCEEFNMLVTTKCLQVTVNGTSGAYAKSVIGLDIPSV